MRTTARGKRSLCALDIGGTLAKVAFLRPVQRATPPVERESAKDPFVIDNVRASGGLSELFHEVTAQRHEAFDICVTFFRTAQVNELIHYLREERLVAEGSTLSVTGGGAFKFAQLLETELKVTVSKYDEMRSAVYGLTFMLSQPRQVFKHDLLTKRKEFVQFRPETTYPFMLVNIGSGVSILKATSAREFTRISGTCVGGGTVMGLARILIGAKDFDEVCRLAADGSTTLDLTASDLLGDCAGGSALPADTLASSFGKLHIPAETRQDEVSNALAAGATDIRKEDIARSLVTMVSYNLGYLAYLLGRLHRTFRLFFTGKYINNQSVTIEAIAEAVQFYSFTYGTEPLPSAETALQIPPQDAALGLVPSSAPLGSNERGSNRQKHCRSAPACCSPANGPVAERSKNGADSTSENPFEVFSLLRDGYIGAVGALFQVAGVDEERSGAAV